jgi:hypothetical protein
MNMPSIHFLTKTILVCGILASWPARAEVGVLSEQAPWRVWVQQGGYLTRMEGALTVISGHSRVAFNPDATDWLGVHSHRLTPQPPANWTAADFDDNTWPRYLMGEIAGWIGGYGAHCQREERLWGVMARTRFGVTDPAKVVDLKLTAEYLGGIIVYVNGKEVGRAHMRGPAEQEQTWEAAVYRQPDQPRRSYSAPQSGIWALAQDYPEEAYKLPDGSCLPAYRKNDARLQAEEILARYQKRVRRATIPIPGSALVKGVNVLAIEIRHAAIAYPDEAVNWSHAGLRDIQLTAASGAGLADCDAAAKETRVWSADAFQPVAGTLPDPTDFAGRGWLSKGDGGANVRPLETFSSRAFTFFQSAPAVGILAGNPFDPIRPIRILTPRNGVGVGQVVVADSTGLTGLSATVGDLKSADGGVLPSSAVQINYAVAAPNTHYLEALSPTPPANATTVPVWLRVRAPKQQRPGWYSGTVIVKANGKSFQVPVQVMVTGFMVPAPHESNLAIGFVQSWDTLASYYQVPLWSPEHWALIERSLALMGEWGNAPLIVPVLTLQHRKHAWKEPLIRFVRQGDRLVPDYSVFEKYLDLYIKQCGLPRVVSVEVYHPSTQKRAAWSNNGSRASSRESRVLEPPKVKVVDPATGASEIAEIPQYDDPAAREFYTTLVNGVRDIVVKRGMPEKAVVLGIGGDVRPAQEHGELFRQWLPYARWHLLSHFNADPGCIFYMKPDHANDMKFKAWEEGRYIAVGELEIGLREDHTGGGVALARNIEKIIKRPWQMVWLGTLRGQISDFSAPYVYAVSAAGGMAGETGWGRIGLEYWDQSRNAPVSNLDYFTQLCHLAAPGPQGALPTVRLEMIRQGMQVAEARRAIVAALVDKPDAEKAAYWKMLDDLHLYTLTRFLPNAPAAYDWFGLFAEQYALAGKLTGQKDEGAWEQPPPFALGTGTR